MAISVEQSRLLLGSAPSGVGGPWRGCHVPDPSRSAALLAVILVHAAGIGGLLAATVTARRAVPENVVAASIVPEAPTQADEALSLPSPRQWRPVLPEVPVPQVAVETSTAISLPPPVTTTPAAAAQGQAEAVGPPLLDAQAVGYLVPPAPRYPPASRRLREQGDVLVRVLIDADGRPREVDVLRSSGHARLDAAAVEAVRAALFRPYVAQGRARAAYVRVPVEFALRRG